MGTEKFTKDFTNYAQKILIRIISLQIYLTGELNLLEPLTNLHMALIFNHLGVRKAMNYDMTMNGN